VTPELGSRAEGCAPGALDRAGGDQHTRVRGHGAGQLASPNPATRSEGRATGSNPAVPTQVGGLIPNSGSAFCHPWGPRSTAATTLRRDLTACQETKPDPS
jgi:hypothetical protein